MATEGKRAISAQVRKRDAFKTPYPLEPQAKAVTISAAAVFKKQKPDTPQLRSSSRTPLRPTVKRTAGKTEGREVHPLTLAFKESSEEYRRHLYSNAVTKIDKDLDALLNRLFESNLQVASSDPANNDSHNSPLKLTVHAKYQRLVQKLCNPLSGHCYLLQQTASSGEVERVQITLHERFQSFEETMQAETEEIKNLQIQWEGVVAEIFQLGVTCLGEEIVATLLSSTEPHVDEAESTLFVPEQGSSVHTGESKRKRMSFADPDMGKLLPGFLFRTPVQRRKPIPSSPELPADGVQQLEQTIVDLGKPHVAELQLLEKEHQAWWKKKQKQLAHTFMQD
ncbi:hypothetical protein E8E12_003640 [Didymella heteroderae]|uniref:Uncharacterized protein n=1 Tax=Didymella heteroderae TaxID=1769908 RepID=A0A9P4WHN3_9PLEO|nr:hypothetical protein E8E12_003640 [Didymella heteroderae]